MDAQKIQMGEFNLMTYSIGSGDNTLLLIHGGPGNPCNYLRDSHLHLAEHGLRVVTWDQLGCGNSDKPADPSLWQLGRFVKEVEAVRSGLNLGKVHILGHSWGGILGLEYCLQYFANVKSFIAVSIGFDMPHIQRGFEKTKLALGEETYKMIAKREAQGATQHPEYQAAMTLLRYRHVCRLEQWPESCEYSRKYTNKTIQETMFGPYAFNCTGNLRDYTRIDQLHRVQTPTLIIHGDYDYIDPELANIAKNTMPNAELALLQGCSHTPFYEAPEQYQAALLPFLAKQ